MVVNSLFYGALHCTDVMFDGVVCFYRGFIYDVFIQEFFLPYSCIGWRGVLYCWWMRFFCCVFFIICDMLFMQLLLSLMFLLKILARGLLLGTCLEIKFRKSLPILDVMHLL